MKSSARALVTAGFVLGIASVAWAQHEHGTAPMDEAAIQQMVKDMMPQPSDTPSTKAFKEAHMKMMRGMHIAYSGNADVDFVRGMIAHHQGAIDMADVELQFGKEPVNQKLARDIIRAQKREITQMKTWLKMHVK